MAAGAHWSDHLDEARPLVVARLAKQFRDLDRAEDGFADACELALGHFGGGDAPRDLAAWLYVAARRRILDTLRRERRHGDWAATEAAMPGADAQGEEAAMIDALDAPFPDHRLALIFTCCHPAIDPQARMALTLRTICGVSTARIAEAFLMREPAMFQRLIRAKAKIARAGIAFEMPARRFWGERLEAVLATLEIAYALAYQDAGAAREEADLAPEALRLTGLLAELIPDNPEVLGMAALVRFAESRRGARVDAAGAMVPLSEQDTARWDGAMIGAAVRLMERAAAFQASGPYQLMAAIHLTHARRRSEGQVDWAAIVALYDMLLTVRPGDVTRINRAVALARRDGAEAGLAALGEVDADRCARYRPYHAAQAHLLAEAGRAVEAAEAYGAALALDPAPAERLYLERRLEELADK